MNDKKKQPGVYSGTTVRDAQVPKTIVMTGWKLYSIVGMFVGTAVLLLYPIVADPILLTDKYREAHKRIQTELFQAGLLPEQLKKLDDPFKLDKKED